MESVMVSNSEGVKIIYDEVEDILYFTTMFVLHLKGGLEASFHYVDDEGIEWYSDRLIRLKK